MPDEPVHLMIEHAKNIHHVLEDFVIFAMSVVSTEIKEAVSDAAYEKIVDLYMKYHNANCGPLNRALRKKIEEAEKELITSEEA